MNYETQIWAEEVIRDIEQAAKMLELVSARIDAYDKGSLWYRLLMGGRLYRWYCVVLFNIALDDYLTAELKTRN